MAYGFGWFFCSSVDLMIFHSLSEIFVMVFIFILVVITIEFALININNKLISLWNF